MSPRHRPTHGAIPVLAAALVLLVSTLLPSPVAWAVATDPGPDVGRTFPPDYGPDPSGCFSPYSVPVDAWPETAEPPTAPPDPLAPPSSAQPAARVCLVLNVGARRLYVYQDGALVFELPTAVGAASHFTPIGRYKVISKGINPTWYPPLPDSLPVPPGPDNPLGSRWIGWSPSGFGLHGTNADWSIGLSVSLGCVRMHNSDVEKVFELVNIGTPFRIVYEPVEVTPFPAAATPEDAQQPTDAAADSGQVVIRLFPDTYRRLPDYRARLEASLTAAGRALDPALVAWLVGAAARYGGATFDTASPFFVGSRRVEAPILQLGPAVDSPPLVPVRVFAETFGLAVGWDASLGGAVIAGVPVQSFLVAGRAFASLDDLAAASGLGLDWTWETVPSADRLVWHRLAVYPGAIYVNNVLVSTQAFREAEGTYVPLRTVAQALGLEVTWEPVTSTVRMAGSIVPVRLVDGRSFVLSDVLAAALYGWATVAVTPDGVSVTR